MRNANEAASLFGKQALELLKTRSSEWWSKLSAKQQDLAERVFTDVGELSVSAASGDVEAQARLEVALETLAGLGFIGAVSAARAAKDVVLEVLGLGLKVLASVLLK